MIRKFNEVAYEGSEKVVEKAVVAGFLSTRNNAEITTKTVTAKGEDAVVLDGNPFIVANIYDSEKKEYVSEFVNVIAWRKLAENFAKAAKPGTYIIAVGTWQEREYPKQDGSKGISKDLVLESFKVEAAFTRDVLKKSGTGESSKGAVQTESKPEVKSNTEEASSKGAVIETTGDDDLPF